jgi:predicted exporter/lauroyl/myristoyl acyltransferase
MKPRLWGWLAGLLLIPMAIGAARLRFDTEVLNLLPTQARPVQALKLYQQHFSSARELILSVRAPTVEAAQATAERLARALRQRPDLAAGATWQPPWLEHPDQAAEFAAYLWLNQSPETFGALTNRLLGTNALVTLATTRERLATSLSPLELARLSQDPFDLLDWSEVLHGSNLNASGQDAFASADGSFRLLFVEAAVPLDSYRACRAWLHGIHTVIDSALREEGMPAGVVVRYTGRPAFVSEIADGMELDIKSSVAGTLGLIVLLFLWVHRSWRPLAWLVTLLLVLLGATLSLGTLLLGSLNVVSAGFAAILLGLSVDYALILYQEHRAAPGESTAGIRRQVAPSIVWSALTTAGAFLTLNLCGLPGLGQLGSLVALGVILAAVVMLYAFLPPLIRRAAQAGGRSQDTVAKPPPVVVLPSRVVWMVTAGTLVAAVSFLSWRPPVLDRSPDPLRPRRSPAYGALEEIQRELSQPREPFWLIVTGQNESEVATRLDQASLKLKLARDRGQITGFTLPSALWPRPAFQQANRSATTLLLEAGDLLCQQALDHGFTPQALHATQAMFDTWRQAAKTSGVFWPTNHLSRWVLGKFAAQSPGQVLGLGLVYPSESRSARATPPSANQEDWQRALQGEGVWLGAWSLLGAAVLEVVQADFWRVLLPMFALLLFSLWLAFNRPWQIGLSLATLAVSGLALLGVMALAGWSWNLLNLTAVPLLIGAGVDYSIHMQLALQRHHGDVILTRRIIGRALLLCAGTTAAGFGSLAWSRNAGLASLGRVCATGVILTYLVSIYLLPGWWTSFASRSNPCARPLRQHTGPSALYRTALWRAGLRITCLLPARVLAWLCRSLSGVYWHCNVRRRDIVIQNLLPALQGDVVKARSVSRELFAQFAGKIADLWRYESGQPIEHLVSDLQGWQHLAAARQRKRGILLLTPHLGNWELGAPLLVKRDVPVCIITLEEPAPGLTELRQASRSRWGIDTLVIGQNPFAFVEVIRRLENGSTVALLVDRPPPSSATPVELFGRPFLASLAAAELARASGCILLPVYVPKIGAGYRAEVLPEIAYDRAALGSRQGRQQLTGKIMRAFEPVIQQHLSQWYHFVPVWPENGQSED